MLLQKQKEDKTASGSLRPMESKVDLDAMQWKRSHFFPIPIQSSFLYNSSSMFLHKKNFTIYDLTCRTIRIIMTGPRFWASEDEESSCRTELVGLFRVDILLDSFSQALLNWQMGCNVMKEHKLNLEPRRAIMSAGLCSSTRLLVENRIIVLRPICLCICNVHLSNIPLHASGALPLEWIGKEANLQRLPVVVWWNRLLKDGPTL